MKTRWFVAVAAFSAGVITVPAVAGEVNGSTTNPKHYYSQGRSVCKFSGLNDNPDSTNPMNPGGRTQSYGQEVRLGLLDPLNPLLPMPGDFCNPNGAQEEDTSSD